MTHRPIKQVISSMSTSKTKRSQKKKSKSSSIKKTFLLWPIFTLESQNIVNLEKSLCFLMEMMPFWDVKLWPFLMPSIKRIKQQLYTVVTLCWFTMTGEGSEEAVDKYPLSPWKMESSEKRKVSLLPIYSHFMLICFGKSNLKISNTTMAHFSSSLMMWH